MNKTILFIDEDFTDLEYELDLELTFDSYEYGADADGNRGEMRTDIDWMIESVRLDSQPIKPERNLRIRMIDHIERWIDNNGSDLVYDYKYGR